jgi:arsenate reductase
MKTVLFACVHNAGRSQMAAAIFNELADPTKARAISAGTQPGTRVHGEVVEVMREMGIDLESVLPTKLTDDLAAGANILVTMGCGEACPVVPGVEREDWPLEDPKGQPLPASGRFATRLNGACGGCSMTSPRSAHDRAVALLARAGVRPVDARVVDGDGRGVLEAHGARRRRCSR